MNKRLISVISILVCIAVLFTGCSIGQNVSTVGSVNGEPVYTKLYEFFAKYQATNEVLSMLGTMEEGWQDMEIDGQKAGDLVREKAFDETVDFRIRALKAYDMGLVDEATLDTEVSEEKKSIIEQMGGQESFQGFLDAYSLEEETIDLWIRDYVLAQKVIADLMTNDEAFVNVSDEDAKNYYNTQFVNAKHILIPFDTAETVDEEGNTIVPTEEEAEAKALATANEVIGRLKSNENFETLIEEYNQDPGQDVNTGYTFTKGQMVAEFETAAFELEVGEYTQEPVKTYYGYHIIKRYDLPESNLTENIESYKEQYKYYMYEELVKQWTAEADIKKNEGAIKKVSISNE